MSTRQKLTNAIMEYWDAAVQEFDGDYMVNKIICRYAESVGIFQDRLNGDVFLTVENMTNSQKRELIGILNASGILE